MGKIINFIKRKSKFLIIVIIGLTISVSIVYGATILYQANDVGYDNRNSGFLDSNGDPVEDVQTALDELYDKASSCSIRNICPPGMKRIEGLNGEYSCVNPKSPEGYIKSLNTEGDTISTSDHNNELRFIGANPPNYVKFNGNQIWRIIGIFDGKLKIIQTAIGLYSWDTSKETVNRGLGVNEWTQSDIMKLLNPGFENNSDLKCNNNTNYASNNGDGYSIVNCGNNSASSYTTTNVNNSLYWNAQSGLCYTYGNHQASACDFTNVGLSDSESKNMIDNATWYLGSHNINEDPYGSNQIMTAEYLYDMERGINNGKQCNADNYYCSDTETRVLTWTGKVGLLYPSDYAFATKGGNTHNRATCLSKQIGYVINSSTPNWNNTYTDCKNNDWLYNRDNLTWTMSPRAHTTYATMSYIVDTSGYIYHSFAMNSGWIKPVVYLKSDVTITKGDGTKAKPFELSYDEE